MAQCIARYGEPVASMDMADLLGEKRGAVAFHKNGYVTVGDKVTFSASVETKALDALRSHLRVSVHNKLLTIVAKKLQVLLGMQRLRTR